MSSFKALVNSGRVVHPNNNGDAFVGSAISFALQL